jgi:hypothetical protein
MIYRKSTWIESKGNNSKGEHHEISRKRKQSIPLPQNTKQ